MQPKISVIIPIYNVEKYINECLDSILSQSLVEIEIICVDDCGSDNSIKIVNKYAENDPRIIIVSHKINSGLGAARNTGMSQAKGEYIGFVDSDDYILSNFYYELYSEAKKYDADIVQSTITLLHEHNNTFEPYGYNNLIIDFDSRQKKLCQLDIYYNSGMCWNKIYRTNLIRKEKILFPESLYWEDNPFVIKAAFYANKIIPKSNTSYIYRQRKGSIVTLGNKKLHFDLLLTHEIIISFLNNASVEVTEYLLLFHRMMQRIYYEYIKLDVTPELKNHKKSFKVGWLLIYKKCKYPNQFKYKYRKTHLLCTNTRIRTLFKIFGRCFAILLTISIIILKLIIYAPITSIIYLTKKNY